MKKKKNILLCPLDWGLGHASRCVPMIYELNELGQQVIVGASNRPLAFLQNEFPGIKCIDFPGYDIQYPQKKSMTVNMLKQVPVILKKIKEENLQLRKIAKEHEIDMLISDNRYGLWHPEIPSIFMTHQLRIKARSSLFESILKHINQKYIQKFDQLWVPDFEGGQKLSGDLSHEKSFIPTPDFIGPQSRFSIYQPNDTQVEKYDLVVMISGPEPQRSLFEEKLLDQLKDIEIKTLVLAGKPEIKIASRIKDHLELRSHMDSKELMAVLKKADVILSRPGYSTIMDLAYLQKKAIFIPTPGQTEQEYLANYHSRQNHCLTANQKDFNLKPLLKKTENIKGFNMDFDLGILRRQLENLI